MDNLTIIIIGTGLFFFLLTCWALLDIANKDFGGIEKKAMWGFISLFPFIGPIVYFSMGFRRGSKPGSKSTAS